MSDTISIHNFVAELTSLYPMSQKNAEAWMKRYLNVLNEVGNIDFKRLWGIFDSEYMSTVTPPSSKWLKEAAIRAKIGQPTGDLSKFATITVVHNGGIYEFVYNPQTETDKAEKLLEKYPISWYGKANEAPKMFQDKIDKMNNEFLLRWRT